MCVRCWLVQTHSGRSPLSNRVELKLEFPSWVKCGSETARLKGSVIPPTTDSIAAVPKMPAVCHVWTAPPVQEESDVSANGRVRSCIRPFVAAAVAAGHDVIRESGPNQKHALVSRVAHNGLPDQRSTVSHHVVFTPANRERYAESHMALLPTFS